MKIQYLGLAIATLGLLLIALQYAVTRTQARQLARTGRRVPAAQETVRLIEVGDHGPAVVFLAGLGNSALSFSWILPLLAADSRAVAVDRPGLGGSGALAGQADAGAAADAVASAMDSAGLDHAVLVGHSYGGLVARVFAARYPGRCRGLVLVDAAHEDQFERFPGAWRFAARLMLYQHVWFRWVGRFALLRVPGALRSQGYGLPPELQRDFYAELATNTHRAAAAAEARAWGVTRAAARASTDLGSTPLVVLATDQWPKPLVPVWIGLQSELAARSTRGKLRVIAGANHVTIAMSREYAPVVAAAIQDVLAAR